MMAFYFFKGRCCMQGVPHFVLKSSYSTSGRRIAAEHAKVKTEVRKVSFTVKAEKSYGFYSRFYSTGMTTRSEKTVPMYDFNRFKDVFNGGKSLRWPLETMKVGRFVRPDKDADDKEVLQFHLKTAVTPLKDIRDILPEVIPMGKSSSTFEPTKHDGAMFIGLSLNEKTGNPERYLLKFFPKGERFLSGAKREVMFSYGAVECRAARHVPKIGLMEIGGYPCVIRRFYKGQDGRCLYWNGVPAMLGLSDAVLVENFALRFSVFGDLDRHNPGNIIFTRHSQLTNEAIVNIDGEAIMPDENSMKDLKDTSWQPGEPIPFTCEWLKEVCETLGPDGFFERFAESENPYMMLLRKSHTLAQMKGLPLADEVVFDALKAQSYLESLARSFGVVPLETLRRDEADFQKVLAKWKGFKLREPDRPITLFQLVTGVY